VAVVFSAVATWRVLGTWSAEEALRRPIAAALADADAGGTVGARPDDVVMSADPGAYRFLAGRAGIVTPNDPLPVVEEVLRAYGARWLVLERAHVVPSMAPILLGETRPAWLSAPILTSGRVEASPTGGPASDSIVLYAVCLEPGDTRCSP